MLKLSRLQAVLERRYTQVLRAKRLRRGVRRGMTLEGAVGAPERLDELKTMYEDAYEHRSLQLDRQQHGCSLILMPLTVTACPRARSDLTCLSGSMAALRAPCALPCVAMLVGSCGRAGTRGSRLQGSGMYRVSKSDESWCT